MSWPGLGGYCAEPGETIFDDVRFRRISVDEGLSQSTVRAIAQDAQGSVWVGTIDGLNRMDAHSIRVYRHEEADPGSLPENHVGSLAIDRDGRLWAGMVGGGVARYDPETDGFERIKLDLDGTVPQAESVSAMVADPAAGIWIATAAGGLRLLDGRTGQVQLLPLDPGPATRSARDLLIRRDGRLLVATRVGVFEYSVDRRSVTEIGSEDGPLDAHFLAESTRGSVFVGTGNDGLVELVDGAVKRRWTETDGLISNAVRHLEVDASNRIWIGTNSGVSLLDPRKRKIRSWSHDPIGRTGLGGHRVESMMIDRDGLLWVGTWANGISIHDPQTEAFQTFKYRPDHPRYLSRPTVTAVTQLANGQLLVGLHEEGGAARIDVQQGVVQRYLHDPARADSIAASSISSVLETRDGSLWIATQTAGLSRLSPGSVEAFQRFRSDPKDPGSLSSNNVADLLEDRAGNLWVATIGGGVNRLCPGCSRFERIDDRLGLGSTYANALLESADGSIWIGYRTLGLDRLDVVSGKVDAYRAGTGAGALSSNAVTYIHEDRRGRLWVATQGGGLNRGSRGADGRYEFRALRRSDGLGSDMVSSVGEDSTGMIWAATSVGISRISPDDVGIVNFGWSEGAQSRGYFVGAVAMAGADEFYFGGLEGITRFDARKVGEPRPPRRPLVSAISVFNRDEARIGNTSRRGIQRGTGAGADLVALAHDDDIVHFELSTFSFANPESVRYAYRLDGFDDNWVSLEEGSNRATFTDLAAGHYTLHVRAAGPRSQRWIDMERPLTVKVASAPWWNPWAILAYLLVLAALGWWLASTLWRAVRERLAAQQQLRQSEQRLALALEASGDEIWECDFERSCLIRFTPHIGLRIPNTSDPVPLASLRDIVHPEDVSVFDSAMRDVLKGVKDQMRATYRMGLANGGWLWVQSYGRVVDHDGRGLVRRIAGVSRDVSEIMGQEEALQRINQDLERRVDSRTRDFQIANEHLRRTLDDLRNAQKQLVESEKMAALGGLVAGVAHEINTPLGIGVTAASHLETESKRLAESLRQNVMKRSDLETYIGIADESSQIILRNLRRADHLIKSFKQVAVDQSSEQRRIVNLSEYLDEILTSLQPRLKKTPYEVRIDCPPDIIVDTYPGALYQVFVNLVMNSLIHAFEGRDHGRIDVMASLEGAEVVIHYRDDGRGMAPEVVARIFEPFFTTKRGQGGSGLGMHIVYNLVSQLLDGTVRCDSSPGNGVQFHIVFPARRSEPEQTTR